MDFVSVLNKVKGRGIRKAAFIIGFTTSPPASLCPDALLELYSPGKSTVLPWGWLVWYQVCKSGYLAWGNFTPQSAQDGRKMDRLFNLRHVIY